MQIKIYQLVFYSNVFAFLFIVNCKAGSKIDSISFSYFNQAFYEISLMLKDTNKLNFEEAVFTMENAWHDNKLSASTFKNTLEFHTNRIALLAEANKEKIKNVYPTNYSGIAILTKEEQEKLNQKVLVNWAIYNYITDTTWWKNNVRISEEAYTPNYPIEYDTIDPFGNQQWETSQVSHLLNSDRNKGNCFSMSLLYYLFSLRLQSDAYLATAPQHIYIQHKGFDGDYYNVELTTRIFPGSGTIKSQTHTTHNAVTHHVAMRRLSEKESIALCLVYLAKSFEKKLSIQNSEFRMMEEEFMLDCANKALEFDSLCLSAMFLKAQLLKQMLSKEQQGYLVPFNSENTTAIDPAYFALSIDPLAEKFPGISPYNAMANDPVNMIDPSGKAPNRHYDGTTGRNITTKYLDYLQLYHPEVNIHEAATVYGGDDPHLQDEMQNALYEMINEDAIRRGISRREQLSDFREKRQTVNRNLFTITIAGVGTTVEESAATGNIPPSPESTLSKKDMQNALIMDEMDLVSNDFDAENPVLGISNHKLAPKLEIDHLHYLSYLDNYQDYVNGNLPIMEDAQLHINGRKQALDGRKKTMARFSVFQTEEHINSINQEEESINAQQEALDRIEKDLNER